MATAIDATSAASQANQINLQDFLKILTSELTNQDPLEPMNNQEFVAQIAQFTSLEQARELNAKIDTLLGTQASLQSVGLLGKTVQITGASGSLSGQVVGIDLQAGVPALRISTTSGTLTGVGLGDVVSIQ